MPTLSYHFTQYNFDVSPDNPNQTPSFSEDPNVIGYTTHPTRSYFRESISTRTRIGSVWGTDPGNPKETKYKHEFVPEVQFTTISGMNETQSAFFNTNDNTPAFLVDQPITDSEIFDPKQHKNLQFDYNDRINNRNVLTGILTNKIIKKFWKTPPSRSSKGSTTDHTDFSVNNSATELSSKQNFGQNSNQNSNQSSNQISNQISNQYPNQYPDQNSDPNLSLTSDPSADTEADYLQIIGVKVWQSYDLDAAMRTPHYPWSDIDALLDFRLQNFESNILLRYFPYHNVTNSSIRSRIFDKYDNFLQLTYNQSFQITENLDDANTYSESIGVGAGIVRRYIKVSGNINLSPIVNYKTDYAINSWDTFVYITPPGNCWGVGFHFNHVLNGNGTTVLITYDYQFGGGPPQTTTTNDDKI